MTVMQTAVLKCDGCLAALPSALIVERSPALRARAAAAGWTKRLRNGSHFIDHCPQCSADMPNA